MRTSLGIFLNYFLQSAPSRVLIRLLVVTSHLGGAALKRIILDLP